jgi:hypothetical protein
LSLSTTSAPFYVGASLIEQRNFKSRTIAFPAMLRLVGSPSIPMIVSYALHQLFRWSSRFSLASGAPWCLHATCLTPFAIGRPSVNNGKLRASLWHYSRLNSGILTWNSGRTSWVLKS